MTYITLFALLLSSLLSGCSSVPGMPSCDKVRYERDGKAFKFYCEGNAGMLGASL